MKATLTVLGVSFDLIPHPMDQQPASAFEKIGYVEFAGSHVLKRAKWRRGGWVDHAGRAFADQPVRWYSLDLRHG